MPSIQVTGQLVDPTTGVEGSADIRIASLINYGQTTKKSISHKSTDASGNYDFQLVYGKHLIFVKYEDERIYIPIGYAVVGDSTPDPIDLIQLINLSDENPPSELVTDLQQLREDTLNDIVSTSAEVLENAGYKGLWPDTGGSALKGETYQTQVGGTPTGDYYTALQNTSVDPAVDNINWKVGVSGSYVNQAQGELINGKIFPESGTVKNGDTVPEGTTHLRVLIGGEVAIVAMSPTSSGVVSLLTDAGANIGGVSVSFYAPLVRVFASVSDMTSAQTLIGGSYSTGGTTWKKVSDSSGDISDFKPLNSVKLSDFGLIGDGATNDEGAKNILPESIDAFDGLGLTYLIDTIPDDFNKFSNANFLLSSTGIEYPTDDFLKASLSQITKTPTYTAWSQDKACQHNGVIFVPIQLAHGHTLDTTRLAWVKSFDGGDSWTSPEIILDVHPSGGSGGSTGWNCFSSGVINNRFVMVVEERDAVSGELLDLYLYDRILSISERKENGIALTSGSSIATITEPSHGLVAGDKVNFSSVSGTDVSGLSGTLAVTSVIDADTFQVDKGIVSGTNQSDTGGTGWFLGATFYNNDWRITSLGTFPDGSLNPLTHAHSFAVKDAFDGSFFFGFHNGAGSREVGVIHVENFWGIPTTTKRRIPSTFEPSQAEPAICYDDGKLYLTTRGQSNTSNGSVFAWSNDDGVTWTAARFPNNLHYSPLPLFIYEGVAHIFGTERRPREWDTTEITRYEQGRTRSFLLRAPVSELEALDFSNLTTTVLGYGRYEGEQASSACGVGSALLYGDSARYYFGSEDFRDSTRYSLNTPSVDDEYIGDGYQPDLFEYRIELKRPLAAKNKINVRCPDNQSKTFYRKGSELRGVAPHTWEKLQKFLNGIEVTSGEVGLARFLRFNDSDYGAFLPDSESGFDDRRTFIAGGGKPSSSRGGLITCHGADHSSNPNDILFATTTALSPSSDNVSDLGKVGLRIKDGYFVNTPVGTSDANLKTDKTEVPLEWITPLLNIVDNVELWRWIEEKARKESEGKTARLHSGPYAQAIYSEFEAIGVDAFDYGFVGKDLHYKHVITGIDEDGIDVIEKKPVIDDNGDHAYIWNIRATELQWLCLWAIRQRQKEIETSIGL